jgi:hypothetical protein
MPTEAVAPSDRLRRLFRVTALIVFLGLAGAALAHVSIHMHPRFLTLDKAVASQVAIYERTMMVFEHPEEAATWRNRIIIPYTMKALTVATGMSPSRAYLLTRWLSASLALGAFMLLTQRALNLNVWGSAAAAAMLAVSLMPTFLHIYEIPSDFLDATFFSLLVLCALERNKTAFALVLPVALLNRESAIFSLFVWFALYAFRPGGWRTFLCASAWCGVLGLLGTGLVMGLRIANAAVDVPTIQQGLQPFDPRMFWSVNARMLDEFLTRPSFSHPYFFLVGYLGLLALIVSTEWADISKRMRRLLGAAAGIFLLSIVSNNLDELRIFIPSLVLCSLALTAIAQRKLCPTVAVDDL